MKTNNPSLIANALKAKRYEVANIFANALYLAPRWKSRLEAGKSNWPKFLKGEFFAYVDYLVLYFESKDDTYKDLFLGEKIKSQYDQSLRVEERQLLAKKILAYEEEALENILKHDLGNDWDNFINSLKKILNPLITTQNITVNVLCVGDCLFLDIIPFVVGPLISEGISVNVEYVASKSVLEVRDDIKGFSNQKIDLIFFSPFTYDVSPTLASMYSWRNALQKQNKTLNSLESAWEETKKTIQITSDLFDCPIYVHNTSFIIRELSNINRFIKLKLTSRIRHFSKNWLNKNIPNFLDQINNESFRHVFLFDETKQLESVTEIKAGSLFYYSDIQHPSVMGMEFAKGYVDIIYANAKLRKKKLIVCDLDNTLWDGVIGEGAVEHFHDRQTILKGLRKKGIVLAINSKNDPKNVHWTNATLTENDFVYEAINWQPKVQNMSRIPDELNLKINSFIFIDDRSDELELMKEAYPDVLCLNATDPMTWERLAIWEHALEDDQEMDRTLMYQQREQRKEFVKEEVTSDEDRLAMFSSLGLQLSIKRPESNEIKRVTELINRTNQFNLEGTRVSLADMNDWFNDKNYIILSGRTSDRFGDMGVTCVTVGKLSGEEFRIIAFVLSCRVFGYHFEHSVMNYLKTLAAKAGAKTIKAKYVATAVNAPCKDFLKDNGFVDDGEFSYFDLSKETQADAPWISVKTDVSF